MLDPRILSRVVLSMDWSHFIKETIISIEIVENVLLSLGVWADSLSVFIFYFSHQLIEFNILHSFYPSSYNPEVFYFIKLKNKVK